VGGQPVQRGIVLAPFSPTSPTVSEKVLTSRPSGERVLDGSVVNFGGLFPSLICRPKEE
jgi:hypothetical protein